MCWTSLSTKRGTSNWLWIKPVRARSSIRPSMITLLSTRITRSPGQRLLCGRSSSARVPGAGWRLVNTAAMSLARIIMMLTPSQAKNTVPKNGVIAPKGSGSCARGIAVRAPTISPASKPTTMANSFCAGNCRMRWRALVNGLVVIQGVIKRPNAAPDKLRIRT